MHTDADITITHATDPTALEEVGELIARAAGRAPAVSDARWQIDAAPRPTLTIDRGAWIQLGVTVEAIAVACAAQGLALALDAGPVARRVELVLRDASIPPGAARLAGCLRREPAAFRSAPLRLAAHTYARLAAAAAVHACELVWFDAPGALHALAGVAAVEAPAGTCAIGLIQLEPGDDHHRLIRAGRACGRVWFEAISLGLAVRPFELATGDAARRLADQLDPSDAALDQIAGLWIGIAT